ncbi:MAG: hypothetical protein JNJ83_18805 [Verrucomicrobiaceae bacterium]|nr:hypothetical protein [Verrucomicrobiaceae bacterium]
MNKVRLDDDQINHSEQAALQDEIEAAAIEWATMAMDGAPLPLKKTTLTLVASATAAATPFPLAEDKPTMLRDIHAALEWTWLTMPTAQVLDVGLNAVFPDQTALPLQVWTDKPVDTLSIARRFPNVQWQTNHRIPQPLPPTKVPAPETASGLEIPAGILVWLGLGSISLFVVRRNRVVALCLTVVLIIGSIPLRNVGIFRLGSPTALMDNEKALSVVEPLLSNAYLAMTHPIPEERASRMGTILEDPIAAERLRMDLFIKGHPGLLAKVRPEQLSVEITSVKPANHGYDLEMTWTVMGTVHHLAHPDTRVNRYKALGSLIIADKQWRLGKIDIQEHKQM